MYSISDMQVFVHVVENKGFSSAGRKLRMTTAVVSSRIIRLENKFNLRLLHRTTRSVRPTEEGLIFYESCKKILDEVKNTDIILEEMREHPTGSLSVSVPVAIGRHVIGPALDGFTNKHSDINLRFQATDRLVDLIGEDFDIAVRKGDPESSSLIKKTLVKDLRIVCGTPAYFEKHGIPKKPSDLMQHNCLLLRFPGSRRYSWQFKEDDNIVSHRVSGNIDTNSSDILIDWALEGRGLISKSVWDVHKQLESGEFVGVLHDYWPDDLDVFALMPPRTPQPAKVRYFLDFLSELFKNHPARRFTDPAEVARLS